MKNLLAVALVVSVASIALSQNPSPAPEPSSHTPQRKPENYQKCEYKVLALDKHDAGTIEEILNAAAKQGFELERVVGDRLGIMRRNFRSDRMDRSSPVQPRPTLQGGQPGSN